MEYCKEESVLSFSRFAYEELQQRAILYNQQIVLRKILWERDMITEEERKKYLTQTDLRSVHFLATTSIDQLVGTCQFDPVTGRLRQVVVSEHYRSCGLGRKLVTMAEIEARKRGFTELKVFVLEPSLSFYTHIGFVIDKEQDDPHLTKLVKAL